MTLIGKLTLCFLCVTLACAGAALPHRDYSHGSNGNLTSRVVADPDYPWIYDAENRLTGVSGAAAAAFVYDGDGNRVKATFGATTTVYVGNTYERDNGSTVRKYYYAGGVRVTMRTGGQTYYLLSDHLGGTNVTARGTDGVELGKVLYRPWGETRFSDGATPTTPTNPPRGALQDSEKMLQSGCTFTTRDSTTARWHASSSLTPSCPSRAIRRR